MANLLGTSGRDSLIGTGDDDQLYGEYGHDNLNGNSGNDYLVGGEGYDTLKGGSGADIFVFNSPWEGIDTIKDFSPYQGDTIQIDYSVFGASSRDEFYYDSSTGALDHLGIQFAQLQPNLDFNPSNHIDFFLG